MKHKHRWLGFCWLWALAIFLMSGGWHNPSVAHCVLRFATPTSHQLAWDGRCPEVLDDLQCPHILFTSSEATGLNKRSKEMRQWHHMLRQIYWQALNLKRSFVFKLLVSSLSGAIESETLRVTLGNPCSLSVQLLWFSIALYSSVMLPVGGRQTSENW